tara:strand:+ start:467 stop:1165 length:699 start_codon:yes stop_codon:yes gene_type:complete
MQWNAQGQLQKLNSPILKHLNEIGKFLIELKNREFNTTMCEMKLKLIVDAFIDNGYLSNPTKTEEQQSEFNDLINYYNKCVEELQKSNKAPSKWKEINDLIKNSSFNKEKLKVIIPYCKALCEGDKIPAIEQLKQCKTVGTCQNKYIKNATPNKSIHRRQTGTTVSDLKSRFELRNQDVKTLETKPVRSLRPTPARTNSHASQKPPKVDSKRAEKMLRSKSRRNLRSNSKKR